MMMRRLLYFLVDLVARFHNKILSLNDTFEYNFSDKQLHFLVIGLLGMLLLLAVHPLFLYLTKKRKVIFISWLYVFTVVVVLTFAIEIGQQISHTGNMEFADIVFGLVGFLAMFAAFCILRFVWYLALKVFRRREKTEEKTGKEA